MASKSFQSISNRHKFISVTNNFLLLKKIFEINGYKKRKKANSFRYSIYKSKIFLKNINILQNSHSTLQKYYNKSEQLMLMKNLIQKNEYK